MKKYLLLIAVVIFGLAGFVFAQEEGMQEEVVQEEVIQEEVILESLDTQLEEASTGISEIEEQKKSDEESTLRDSMKQEAEQKNIKLLYQEAASYMGRKDYIQAKRVYEKLLILDPNAKNKLNKKIAFCGEKITIASEKNKKQLEEAKTVDQIQRARQLAEKANIKIKQQLAEERVARKAAVREHIAMGREYMKNKNYADAVYEFQEALDLEPDNAEAMSYLSDAKMLFLKSSEVKTKPKELTKQEILNYNKQIKDGFNKAVASLNSSDFSEAQKQFVSILENVNKLSIETAQLKTARQIKKSAKRYPDEILSHIRNDKYEEAKKKLWELIQKTTVLAKERESTQQREKNSLLIESYLKSATAYVDIQEYDKAKIELDKVISLDPANNEANTLLERLEDIIAITKEEK